MAFGAAFLIKRGMDREPATPLSTPVVPPSASSIASSISSFEGPAPRTPPVLRLATAHAEFGVLVNKIDVKAVTNRKKLALQFAPALCGSAALCDAAKTIVGDAAAMTFDSKPRKHWLLPTAEQIAAQKPSIAPQEVERAQGLPDLLIVSASGPRSKDHRVARAAFAATSIIARITKGFVVDMSSNRVETAATFDARVVNGVDGQFGAPQLDFQASPAAHQGYVRITTTGLERFGLPDLEASEVTTACAAEMPRVFVAIARQLAREDANSSIHLTTSALDLGADGPLEEGETDVSLVASAPRVGDRMTTLVRVVPRGGANADRYVDMVEQLVGVIEQDHLFDKEWDEVQVEAQKRLPAALVQQRSVNGALLHVLIAFYPDETDETDAPEWLWVEVTSWHDQGIIGIVVDEPTAGSIGGVQRGARISRTRGDVLDFQLRLPDGRVEQPLPDAH